MALCNLTFLLSNSSNEAPRWFQEVALSPASMVESSVKPADIQRDLDRTRREIASLREDLAIIEESRLTVAGAFRCREPAWGQGCAETGNAKSCSLGPRR